MFIFIYAHQFSQSLAVRTDENVEQTRAYTTLFLALRPYKPFHTPRQVFTTCILRDRTMTTHVTAIQNVIVLCNKYNLEILTECYFIT